MSPRAPRAFQNVSRGRRLPGADVHVARDRAHGASGSIRPRRSSIERHGASVPMRVHLPPQLRHTRVSRNCASAPGRRHPRAMAAAPAPDFHPAVWSHQSVGMAPDNAATGRLQHGRYNSAGTKAAPEKSSYHPCRCCAQGRFSAPSLPDRRTRRHAAEDNFGRFRPPAGSDGALRLRPPARRTPATARIIVSPARVTAMPGRRGARRPQDAPAALDVHQPHPRRAAGTVRPHRHHPAVGRRDDASAASARPADVRCVAAMPMNQLRTSFTPMTSTRRAPWPPPAGLRHWNRSR